MYSLMISFSKSTFTKKTGSGWVIHNFISIDANIVSYNPLCASLFIELAKEIENQKAAINIENKTDNNTDPLTPKPWKS